MQVRLDKALVERGLASTRSRAQLMIRSGAILINERLVEKPSHLIKTEDVVRILWEVNPWVSRGGLKLEYAIAAFKLAPLKGIAIDIGASTGGFTEVLLAYGCSKVYAIDVGKDQLNLKLKDDPRVQNIEGVNAKKLNTINLPFVDCGNIPRCPITGTLFLIKYLIILIFFNPPSILTASHFVNFITFLQFFKAWEVLL